MRIPTLRRCAARLAITSDCRELHAELAISYSEETIIFFSLADLQRKHGNVNQAIQFALQVLALFG